MSLSAAALEPDLMGYLVNRFGGVRHLRSLLAPADSLGLGAAADALPASSRSAGVSCGLAELLTRIARSRQAGAALKLLVEQIDSSLESFERAHKGTL